MDGSARSSWIGLSGLAIFVLAADQLSKYAIEKFTTVGSFRVLISGFLNLVHTTNPGVAFGLFADGDAPWRAPILIIFSVGVIAMLLWFLVTGRAGGRLGQWGLAMILGGAAGNVFDRVVRHTVTDFIDFHIGGYHWYTFNIADSGIVIGAGLVILELLRDWKHHPHHERA